jgi:hypothetical protein
MGRPAPSADPPLPTRSPQIEIDVGPAICRFALKGPSPSKLVKGEWPRAFGPDRPIRTVRRLCRREHRVAANPGGKHDGGDGYDPLAHDRCSGLALAWSNATVPGRDCAPSQVGPIVRRRVHGANFIRVSDTCAGGQPFSGGKEFPTGPFTAFAVLGIRGPKLRHSTPLNVSRVTSSVSSVSSNSAARRRRPCWQP